MEPKERLIRGYAQALFAVAQAEGQLDQVEDELFRFGKVVQSRSDLWEALSDPRLPTDRKRSLLQDLLGTKVSDHTLSLLAFLIERGRGKDLPKILEAMAEVAAEARSKQVAEVRTALPLKAEQRKRLQEALSKATGKDVELKVLVDPSVIGGVVARVGDQVFDGTIKRKLELARERLVEVQ